MVIAMINDKVDILYDTDRLCKPNNNTNTTTTNHKYKNNKVILHINYKFYSCILISKTQKCSLREH